MINYKDFSHQLDGLWPEILAQYGIEIPRMRGLNSDNHPCPLCGGDDRAHWRDVGGRLCLFCRGCAADSMHPPENVIMEYASIEFGELVKDLADFVNHVPIERLRIAQNRSNAPKFNLPPDDKRDPEKAREFAKKCIKRDLLGCTILELDGDQFLEVKTFAGELVNVAWLGRELRFVAGGISYGAFATIRKNQNDNFLVVADVWNARIVAEDIQQNVMIAFTPANIKYIVRNAPSNIKCKPVLTVNDQVSDSLCDEMPWLFFDEEKREIVKKQQGEQL